MNLKSRAAQYALLALIAIAVVAGGYLAAQMSKPAQPAEESFPQDYTTYDYDSGTDYYYPPYRQSYDQPGDAPCSNPIQVAGPTEQPPRWQCPNS
jgi:hypothetical protein